MISEPPCDTDRRDSSGAAEIVEAVIVLPLCFAVLSLLLLTFFFFLENASVKRIASEYASVAAEEFACPGYYALYLKYGLDGRESFVTDANHESAAVNALSAVHKPYRYLSGSSKDAFSQMEKNMKKEIDGCLLFRGEKTVCTISVRQNGVLKTVTASVNRRGGFPAILRKAGITSPSLSKTEVTAAVVDPGEFVRNTDTVCDIAGDLLERFGIGSGEGDTGGRLSRFFESFKISSGGLIG